MRSNKKLVLMAASVLSLAVSAHAGNGELIVGFDGANNDFIYDLGAYTNLFFGQTWNLGPGLGSNFGVVGYFNLGKDIYATSPAMDEDGYAYDTAAFNTIRANISTLSGSGAGGTPLVPGQSRAPAPTDATGWSQQTDQPIGTAGNILENNLFNPNSPVGTPAYLFDNNGNLPVLPKGVFTYDGDTGILTYSNLVSTLLPITLSITLSNSVANISFPSTNGATYTLYFTNATGLSAPIATWPSQPTPINGDGTIKFFQDTNTTDSARFYAVKEQ